jgi:hypothetical protein
MRVMTINFQPSQSDNQTIRHPFRSARLSRHRHTSLARRVRADKVTTILVPHLFGDRGEVGAKRIEARRDTHFQPGVVVCLFNQN